ncbi:PimH protein (plasmid) [Neorhizobium galegae bv. officinalis bv. officinalis str. HAMBI 1141]|uniref:PimH protein n=1 Tax=Neorhizobium galegae bv. officinalis bv. officinalis str. HAMBI 1141 TaxID=1028801 RepID=A0A068THA1_NEOGA|nr:MFS transporter [Neorhizobium galegae]CDN57421.1 PimH protein [Neorhizobium galegae bv. officinalis bv. officinalis str. HAMBI 1141]
MSADKVGRYNPLLTLKDPHYRRFAIGSIISVLGMWMQKIGVAWLAWELSKSPFWLGLIAAADMLPSIFLSSFAGSLADAHDKIKVLRSAQSVAILQSVALALLSWLGLTTVEVLLGLTLILGISSSLEQPARLSLIREIVPADYLHAAVAVNALSFNLARFVGPIIAGLLISKVNVGVTFAASAAAIAFFSYALAMIRVQKGIDRPSDGVQRSGTADGFRYVLRHKSLLVTLGLLGMTGISVNGILQMLPAISDALFAKGIDGFVGLMAASAFGSVVSGTITLLRPPSARGLLGIAFAAICATAALAVLALTPNFHLALIAIFCMSFANMYAGIAGQALLQLESEPGKLGRVMGIYSMIIRGGPAVGSFVIGTAATFVGMVIPIVGVAALAACYSGAIALAFRRQQS